MAPMELVLGAPAAGGGFVARGPDGRVVFVRHGIEGERVLAERHRGARHLGARRRDRGARAPRRTASRRPARTPGPGRCGGCDYQHVDARAPSARSRPAASQDQLRARRRARARRRRRRRRRRGRRARARARACASPTDERRAALDATASQPRPRPGRTLRPRRRRRSGRSSSALARSRQGAEVEAVALAGRDGAVRRGDDGVANAAIVEAPHGEPRSSRGRGSRAPSRRPSSACAYDVSPGVFWQVHVDGPEVLVRRGARRARARGGRPRRWTSTAARGSSPRRRHARSGPTGDVVGIDASAAATDDARAQRRDDALGADRRRARRRSSRRATRRARARTWSWTRRDAAPTAARSTRSASTVAAAPARLGVLRPLHVRARPSRSCVDAGWHLRSVRAFDLFEMTEHVECVAVLER